MERVGKVKELKVGSYVMVDGEACKVQKIELSKPGKHGSTKARIEAVGVFDDKKRSLLKTGDADVNIPTIDKRGGQIISVSGDIAQIMDLADYTTFEATIPEELKDKIQPGAEIGYWKFSGKIMLKG